MVVVVEEEEEGEEEKDRETKPGCLFICEYLPSQHEAPSHHRVEMPPPTLLSHLNMLSQREVATTANECQPSF